MPGEGLANVFGGQGLHLIEEQLQVVERQSVETYDSELADNGRIVGRAQRELAADLPAGTYQLRLGRPFADEAVQTRVDDLQCLIHLVGAGLHADHEGAGGLHRDQIAADRIGQAAGLADLLHQPRAEAGAAEYLVADVQGYVVRIMPADAVLAHQYMGLLAIELDMPVAAGDRLGSRGGLGGRSLGQGVGQPLGNAFGPGAVDVADQDRKSTRLNSSHVRISYA